MYVDVLGRNTKAQEQAIRVFAQCQELMLRVPVWVALIMTPLRIHVRVMRGNILILPLKRVSVSHQAPA
jgi:hypothetical protein